MRKALYNYFALLSVCLLLASCSLLDGESAMFPEISVNMPLDRFFQSDTYQSDDLVNAALNHVQGSIGNRGTAFIRDLWVRLECAAGQCLLRNMIVTIAANPLQKPVVILDSDDEFVSVDTDFFFDLPGNSVKTTSQRTRWLSAALPMWQNLPISLTEAQDVFINYAQQNLAQYPRYRIGISLSPQGWTANFYYTDPENTRAAADETLEIPFESQP